MFERFTDRARRVLVLAQEEARLLNHSFIGTEHILLGLIHEGEGVAAQALESLGISLTAVRETVEETIGMAGGPPTGSPPFTPRAKKVLELSLREALQLGHSYIGTEHMLLGLVREGEGVAAQVLVSLGADLGRVRRQVIQLMSGYQGKERIRVVGPGKRPVRTKRGRNERAGSPPDERCILCGRDLWEAAHFVAQGPFHRVCDDCIRSAAELLGQATPEQRKLTMPPRVYGRPPDDQAVAAVVAALELAFGASTDPESRAAVVEDLTEVEHLYDRHADRLAAQPDATSVTRVRFLTEDLAEVRFEIMRSDGAMATFEGQVRRREGRWMVTRDTVASVLVPRGDVLASVEADLPRHGSRPTGFLVRPEDDVVGSEATVTTSHRESPPAGLPAALVADLEHRYAQLPVHRIRKDADFWALRRVEEAHVKRLARRHELDAVTRGAALDWWLGEVQLRCSGARARLHREEQRRLRRVARRRYFRSKALFQLYWNTVGPGGRTWLGNRYATIRRYTFRIRWRP